MRVWQVIELITGAKRPLKIAFIPGAIAPDVKMLGVGCEASYYRALRGDPAGVTPAVPV